MCKISFEIPEFTSDVNGIGVLRLLDAIRDVGINTKFYQASSSELFGAVKEKYQNEKLFFIQEVHMHALKHLLISITQNYREAYNIFATNGILFNHESPRRSENFVTRKITRSLSRIKRGIARQIVSRKYRC